jgi:DNA-binding IscR family transcriptional regulator
VVKSVFRKTVAAEIDVIDRRYSFALGLPLMKISAREEYACSAVLEFALNQDADALVRVQDIAQPQGIPMKFLFQIMQILKRVNIVRSKRRIVQLSCLDSGNLSDACGKPTPCHFKPIWAEVDRAIGSILNNVTFEELARRARANRSS